MSKLSTNKLAQMSWLAISARENAYAPYSHFQVGVALLSGSGTVYVGGNCETANFDSTCAENTAIAAMTSAGERYIDAIVIVGPGEDKLCTPCGRCRQRIREFADDKTRVYCLWPDGSKGKEFSVDQLLPWSFGPEDLVAGKARPVKAKTPKNTSAAKKKTKK